jgi:hypothetical protein
VQERSSELHLRYCASLTFSIQLTGEPLSFSGLRCGSWRWWAWRRASASRRGEPDHVTGADVLDRFPLPLNPAATGGDDQGLAERMRVPRCPRTGLEGYEIHADAGRVRRIVQRVHPDGPSEILGRPFARQLRAALFNHDSPSLGLAAGSRFLDFEK